MNLEMAEAIHRERKRWALWAYNLGYPFDFTNPDAIPDDDMLEAITRCWMDDGWPSFDEARWDVFEEVHGPEETARRLPVTLTSDHTPTWTGVDQ